MARRVVGSRTMRVVIEEPCEHDYMNRHSFGDHAGGWHWEHCPGGTRRVTDPDEVEWCDVHKAAGLPGLDCWGAGLDGQDSCRMVPKLLVDL